MQIQIFGIEMFAQPCKLVQMIIDRGIICCQAIRESASLCRNDDISRQQIGYAIDQLWNNCEQMRIDQCNRINAQTQSSGATNDYVS